MKIEGITIWRKRRKYFMEIEYDDGEGNYPTKRKEFTTISDLLVSVAYYLKRGNWEKYWGK